MKVTGFNHVTIRVSNLSESLTFYREVLGMELVHQGNTYVYLSWGEVWVCLIEIKNPQKSTTQILGIDHIAFSIDETDFYDAVNQLKVHQVPIIRGPIERGGGLTIQFLDPDETLLELFTGNLKKRMKIWV